MNILILSPFFPYPLDQGGKIRVFNIIRELAKDNAVTLAALVDDATKIDFEPLQELCTEIILVERPARLWPDRFAFITGPNPYNVIRYSCSSLRVRLKDLLSRNSFDVVQIEFSMLWQYAPLFLGIPVVLDAHNIEYNNIQQIGSTNHSLFWRIAYRLEEQKLRQVEERAWRECALCFAVSENEREEIGQCSDNRAKVIAAANGVDVERFTFRSRVNTGKKILFLGGMDYTPNLDAAKYFLSEIFPMIRCMEPNAKLLLVGRELGKLEVLLQLPGVEAHESVPEVLPWFYKADVLVVPLRQGAGTRIKVLEAMAAGLPVVSTSKGCEGIKGRSTKELLIADTPEEFTNAVLHILGNPEIGRYLAENARRLVTEHYTWERTGKIIGQAFSLLLPRKPKSK